MFATGNDSEAELLVIFGRLLEIIDDDDDMIDPLKHWPTILFESWSNFFEKPLQLSSLIPRGHAQGDVIQAGFEIGFKLLDALLWAARSGKTLHELNTEVGRVILVEERLALVQRRLTVLIDVDVMIQRAADLSRIAAFFLGHGENACPLRLELRRCDFVSHPAIGEARDAAQSPFDGRTRGTGAVFPGQPSGITGDPDRDRVLHGTRLNRDAFELIKAAFVRCFFLVEEFAQDGDSFLQPTDPFGVLDAHDFVLERLSRALLIGSAETNRQPRPAAGDDIQARPLLG